MVDGRTLSVRRVLSSKVVMSAQRKQASVDPFLVESSYVSMILIIPFFSVGEPPFALWHWSNVSFPVSQEQSSRSALRSCLLPFSPSFLLNPTRKRLDGEM